MNTTITIGTLWLRASRPQESVQKTGGVGSVQ